MKKLAIMALTSAMALGTLMTSSAAWVQDGSTWKYQNEDGTWKTGNWFQDKGGAWYHFDANGIMQKGWFQDVNGKWYFLAYSGAMQIGVIKVDNAVYYMDESGALFTGEKTLYGNTYTFGLNGLTKGSLAVGERQTFGGNGNQSIGSNSDSSGPSDNRPSDSGKVTNEQELLAALAAGKTTINYITSGVQTVMIPEADYSRVTLTVDAPNASIVNEAKFKVIILKAISDHTWTENGNGNTIKVEGNAHIDGSSDDLTVNVVQAANLRLDGTSAKPIKLNIDAANSMVSTSAPVTATATKPTTLAMTPWAVSSGSSLTITAPVKVSLSSIGDAGTGAVAMPVEVKAKATLETAVATAVTISTKEKVDIKLTSKSAAEDISIKANDPQFDQAVSDSANAVENNSEVPATVKTEDSAGTKADVPKNNTATLETVIKNNVASAVSRANATTFIDSATLTDTTITVKTRNIKTLSEAEGTAKSIYDMFKSGEVTSVNIGGTEITDSTGLRAVALNLGLSGQVKLGSTQKSGVNVIINYDDKGTPKTLQYTVNVN